MGHDPTSAFAAASASAERRRDLLVQLRRDLHRIPEPAFGEVKTTSYVRRFLAERGVELTGNPRRTGGVAVIGEGVPRVLLRADMDALPLHESTGLPFASEHPEFMHACGHDAHMAMLLAAADALVSGEFPLEGAVALFFQPAEEGPGGCRAFLDEGLLERHPVRAAFALHVWPSLPVGKVGISEGPLMAGMDRVRLHFIGRGGHGAHPQECVDPIVMAAEAILALQTLVSRTADPLRPAVLTIGAIHGGTAPNIIPEEVTADGTLRAFDEPTRAALMEGVRRVAGSVAAAHGGRCEVEIGEGYPVTANDPGCAAQLGGALREVLGVGAVGEAERTMGAEDMSFLLQRVPGCFLQLGSSADPASAAPLHSSRFAPDEGCLVVGLKAFLAAACVLGNE